MYKKYCLSKKLYLIAGVDESGCGSLVGSVIAAAVILYPAQLIWGLRDSKALSKLRRYNLYEKILKHALSWSIGSADVKEIDYLNILNARLLAMKRAILNLNIIPDLILIDGQHAPKVNGIPCQCFKKGDIYIPIISAASIIAKTIRDKNMQKLDIQYPRYKFAYNNGYPTSFHLKQLKLYGPTVHHRKSFSPIKYMV